MSEKAKTNEVGMIFMIIAMLLLPGIDAIAKFLGESISTGMITWGRFFFQTLLMSAAIFFMQGSFAALKTISWPWQIARGFLIAMATLLFFASLRVLPIADAISIFFIEPLLLTLAAPFLLGETVGWRRVVAVFVGLVGALIVVQPSYAVFGAVALLPMAAAAFFMFYVVLTRRSGGADPLAMQLGAGIGGLLTMTPALLLGSLIDWPVLMLQVPSLDQWLFLAGLGCIATIGHLLIVLALKRMDASIAAPFQYLEIVMATILGFYIFGDFPEPILWVGIALVIGSGMYVFYRERKNAANASA